MAVLGDYIKVKHGYAFKGEFFSTDDNGVVLITPGNFAIGGGFKQDKCKFFTSLFPRDYVLHEDDLIVTMTDLSKNIDTLGYSALIPNSNRIYLHNQRIGLVQFLSDKLDKHYLYWFMRTKFYQKTIVGTSSGSTVHHTSPDRICAVEINPPDIVEQIKIANILDNIENKIANNHKINKNLEQQAQAYFDELFVVNADPNWSECTLSDIGSVVAGGTPSKSKPEYYADQGIAWITPKDLSINKSKFISHGENDISELGFSKSSAAKMPAGTILFSSRAPIGYIAIAQNEVTTNQGFKSVIPNENIGTAYLYFLLKNLLPTIEGIASGSTFKEISGSAMKSVPTVMPDADTIQLFSSFCEPVFKEQEILEAENQRLSALRNSLLPKLMSGELDVSDIDL